MNKLFVWLVGRFGWLWKRLGADPKAIGLILATKLKMDDRGGYVMGQQQAPKSGMESLVFGLMVIFGIMLTLLLAFVQHQATGIGLIFSVWIIYIGMLLVTELSDNLFDARDLYILLSRPIEDITLSLSRMLHIAVFTAKFALCLGLASGIYLLFWSGVWPFIVFVLLSILVVSITMTGTLVFYLLLLRFVSPDRLRKVMGYFQMVASTLFFFAYQIPSLFDFEEGFAEGFQLVGTGWGFVFPGLWIGGLWEVMVAWNPSALALAQGGLALLAAGGGLWFYVAQSKDYSYNLLAYRQAGSQSRNAATTPATATGSSLRDRLAGWFTKQGLERNSFIFHWSIMRRDMLFKQRTYPTLVFVPIILFFTIFRDLGPDDGSAWQGNIPMYLILYMAILPIIVPLGQTKISEQYKASWIFHAAPLAKTGALRYGQFVSVFCMFYLPSALVLYPVCLAIWGFDAGFDILFASGAVGIMGLIYHSLDRALPFSLEKQSGGFQNFGAMLMVFILAPLIGVGHYFLHPIPYLIPVGSVLVWVLFWVLLRELRGETAKEKAKA